MINVQNQFRTVPRGAEITFKFNGISPFSSDKMTNEIVTILHCLWYMQTVRQS